MNKIVIDKENVILEKVTRNLKVNYELRESEFGISKIFIKVLKDTDILFDINIDNSKYYIEIEVDNNTVLNISVFIPELLDDELFDKYNW